MASGNATVKAVLSGDTVLLVGKSVSGSPPEISVTLSNILTPKIARGPLQTDEPFAWEAREFLRKLCVGKQVSFKIVSTVSAINRSFGDIILDGENLNKAVISAGWGSVKDQKDNSEGNDYEILLGLYNSAKAAKLGIHTDEALKKRNAVRQINWTLDAPAYATNLLSPANRPKAGPQSASVQLIVEHVRDGASFRCYIPAISAYVSVSLAGIVCPRVNSGSNKADADGSNAPEAFALQARHFSELRLLNRDVEAAVYGATAGSGKNTEGSLLVTFSHPKGNITLELIKAGLGKVADWTLALLPRETVVSLRAAEIEAKSNRRGVWYAFTPPVPSPECRIFEGRVIEVISGDTIIVAERNPSGGFIETRVSFSSIKVPRLGSSGPGNRTSVSEPFAAESKEFVRSRLIGKQVLVSVEYVRDKRLYASVYYGKSPRQSSGTTRPGSSISEQLIVEGLAQTVKHRPEEPRSESYDTMLVDEAEAQRRKKGVHSTGAPVVESTTRGINDLSTDGKKAKAFFAILQKDKVYRAMVDYVFTGSRYKVTIPSENATIQFALSQIRCPNLAKAAPVTSVELEEGEVQETTEDPLNVWAETAKKFSRLNVLQRMVDLEFTDVDRNGIMIGKLYVTGDKAPTSRAARGNSYAVDLVRDGLASVDKFAASRGGPEVDTLLDAQKKAQESLAGLWSVPGALSQPDIVEKEEEKQSAESGVVRVKLTEIYTGSTFAVHINSPASSEGVFAGRGSDILATIEGLMSERAEELASSPSIAGSVRRGNLVACLDEDPSGADGTAWLRARVEEIIGGNCAKVFFVDYGHRAEVSVNSLRTLTEDLTSFANQAVDCSLAFLRAPPLGSEYGAPAARALNSLAWEKECMMKVLSSSDPSATASNSKSRSKNASPSSSVRYAVVLFSLPPTNGEDELDIDNALNVNEKLVRNGFVRISATAARRLKGGKRRGQPFVYETDHSTGSVAADALSVLEAAQTLAHDDHLRLWAYGDPGDSDDELEDRKAAL